jgi:periplasmic divalent cation tolerance protein
MADEKLSIVLTTAPSQEVANQLAHGLVSRRLAACVTIVPRVVSIYAWEGKLEQAEEALMMIKTRSSRYAEVEQHICTHHPYDTPEIVEIPADQVTQKYLQWVTQETTKS